MSIFLPERYMFSYLSLDFADRSTKIFEIFARTVRFERE